MTRGLGIIIASQTHDLPRLKLHFNPGPLGAEPWFRTVGPTIGVHELVPIYVVVSYSHRAFRKWERRFRQRSSEFSTNNTEERFSVSTSGQQKVRLPRIIWR